MGLIIWLLILTIVAVASPFVLKMFNDLTKGSWIIPTIAVVIGGISVIANAYGYVGQHEVGYVFNKRTGIVSPTDRSGYHIVNPFWEDVHSIDLRPMQVCINANQRVLNCKLVSFNGEGLEIFVKMHGRNAVNGTTGLDDILKAYAYDGSQSEYPFLNVLRELRPEYSDQNWIENFNDEASHKKKTLLGRRVGCAVTLRSVRILQPRRRARAWTGVQLFHRRADAPGKSWLACHDTVDIGNFYRPASHAHLRYLGS